MSAAVNHVVHHDFVNYDLNWLTHTHIHEHNMYDIMNMTMKVQTTL